MAWFQIYRAKKATNPAKTTAKELPDCKPGAALSGGGDEPVGAVEDVGVGVAEPPPLEDGLEFTAEFELEPEPESEPEPGPELEAAPLVVWAEVVSVEPPVVVSLGGVCELETLLLLVPG